MTYRLILCHLESTECRISWTKNAARMQQLILSSVPTVSNYFFLIDRLKFIIE